MSAPVIPDEQTDVPPVVLVPDRAEAPISEITERFFRALLLKVPLDRIEELHLFSPLRSGGVETGIAVIAAREIVVPAPVAEMELALGDGEVVVAGEDAMEVASEDAMEVAMEATVDGEDESGVAAVNEHTERADTMIEVGVYAALDEPSPYADDLTIVDTVEAVTSEDGDPPASSDDVAIDATDDREESAAEIEPESAPAAVALEPPAPAAPIIRHTVYTARYRLVQKGPERGKWEADVVAEAEAPLITVETVVRGVQRRAGEESDTTRFTAAQIARALRIELPAAP